MTEAARVYVDYLFARSLPLSLMLLLRLALNARHMLAGLMVLTAFTQLVDVINDLARGAFVLVPGLLLFAIVFLIGAGSCLDRQSGILMPGVKGGRIDLQERSKHKRFCSAGRTDE